MGKTELKIEIDSEVLDELAEQDLDPAKIAEAALRAAARPQTDAQKAAAWGAENAEAIKAHRKQIDEFGVFGEDLRTW
jgi:post-segregation antitoxin (ccd killing protein)